MQPAAGDRLRSRERPPELQSRASPEELIRYHSVYLSPHLDDAVLSCGGQIASETAAGRQALVVTLAAGDPPPGELTPFARELHRLWGADEALGAARRAEDAAACRRLGAEVLHWELPDGIYRRSARDGRALYPDAGAIFGEPDPEEAGLEEELARRLAALPAAERLLAPLAVGGHVDHRLARRAAALAWGSRVLHYEDFPYVARDRRALERALGRKEDWRAEVVPLDAEALRLKSEAIAAYATQVPSLFGRRSPEKDVLAWARKVGGERLWRRAGA